MCSVQGIERGLSQAGEADRVLSEGHCKPSSRLPDFILGVINVLSLKDFSQESILEKITYSSHRANGLHTGWDRSTGV